MTPSHLETLNTSQPGLQAAPAKTVETAWRPLYRVGGVAALTMIALMVLGMLVYLIDPPPTTVIGYFTLFQKNMLLGLIALDLVYLVSQILMDLILLALCVALRRASPSLIAIALTSGLVGLAVYFASNPAFGMLSLSSHYAVATTAVQRFQFEAAGQAIMANYTGTAYVVSYVLSGIAVLLISVIMLRSTAFAKGTAAVGLIMGAMMLVPAEAGTVGLVFAFGSLVPLVIWLILIARSLFRLGADRPKEENKLPALT